MPLCWAVDLDVRLVISFPALCHYEATSSPVLGGQCVLTLLLLCLPSLHDMVVLNLLALLARALMRQHNVHVTGQTLYAIAVKSQGFSYGQHPRTCPSKCWR